MSASSWGKVLHEAGFNPFRSEGEKAVIPIGLDFFCPRLRRIVLPPVVEGLPAGWRARGDIDKTDNARIVACLSYDCTAPGMAAKNRRTIQTVENTFGGRNVVGQRG